MRKMLLTGAAAVLGLVTLTPTVTSAHSNDDSSAAKPTLTEILLSDSAKDDANGFDNRPWDYDIVTQAVLLFPDLVAAASDPNTQLTVFLPTDQAFRNLVKDITGNWVRAEADVFAAVASLGTDTVKNVLLYHIVPASISYRDARNANGAVLDTLLPGASITVSVRGDEHKRVILGDLDTNSRDPKVVAPNVGGEASNGYAHGINRVLRPIDLP